MARRGGHSHERLRRAFRVRALVDASEVHVRNVVLRLWVVSWIVRGAVSVRPQRQHEPLAVKVHGSARAPKLPADVDTAALHLCTREQPHPWYGIISEKGVRLAQKTQVGPRIPVGRPLEKTEGGPSSGPTWRLSHYTGTQATDLKRERVWDYVVWGLL